MPKTSKWNQVVHPLTLAYQINDRSNRPKAVDAWNTDSRVSGSSNGSDSSKVTHFPTLAPCQGPPTGEETPLGPFLSEHLDFSVMPLSSLEHIKPQTHGTASLQPTSFCLLKDCFRDF